MKPALVTTNLALVRRIVQGVGSNDMRPLVGALDDRVVWRSNTPLSYFRFGGEHLSRGGVLEMVAKLASEYSFIRFEIDNVTETGDAVWAICNVVVHHIPTGRAVTLRLAFRAVFCEGKIVDYEDFFDTVSALHQIGLLPDIPR
jgi:ketosteroid isomerase-like protein